MKRSQASYSIVVVVVDIKLYLQKGIKSEDVKALLAAVLSTDSFDVQEKILRLVLHILRTSDHASVLGHFLMSEGTPLLALLHSHNSAVSQAITNVSISGQLVAMFSISIVALLVMQKPLISLRPRIFLIVLIKIQL